MNKDTIIVLRHFDNTIEANLAKTKLDAYGIPCFLTEENLNNLYPNYGMQLFGVRLHIFEKDASQATQVLGETMLTIDQDSVTCPHCRSTRVERDYSRKFSNRLVAWIVALLIGVGFPIQRVYVCNDCATEF